MNQSEEKANGITNQPIHAAHTGAAHEEETALPGAPAAEVGDSEAVDVVRPLLMENPSCSTGLEWIVSGIVDQFHIQEGSHTDSQTEGRIEVTCDSPEGRQFQGEAEIDGAEASERTGIRASTGPGTDADVQAGVEAFTVNAPQTDEHTGIEPFTVNDREGDDQAAINESTVIVPETDRQTGLEIFTELGNEVDVRADSDESTVLAPEIHDQTRFDDSIFNASGIDEQTEIGTFIVSEPYTGTNQELLNRLSLNQKEMNTLN
jgi:hypothetical protein